MTRKPRSISRRSFLARVAGGAAAGGAMMVLAPPAQGQQNYTGVTDCDTAAGNRDRPGYGRGVRNSVSDNDSGPAGDPPCQGRGTRSGSPTGTTYNPSTQPRTGCSDSDRGQYGDPSGHGRRCRGRDPNTHATQPSGCSDRDPTDPLGDGRNCGPR